MLHVKHVLAIYQVNVMNAQQDIIMNRKLKLVIKVN